MGRFDSAVAQARRILGDTAGAEDVATEAIVRVASNGQADTALPLIVYGLAVDEYRRRMKQVPSGLLDVEPEVDDQLARVVPETLDRAEFRADFDRAVRGLAESERAVFILTELRGLTVREAADVLGLPKSTVADRLQAARTFIREELTD